MAENMENVKLASTIHAYVHLHALKYYIRLHPTGQPVRFKFEPGKVRAEPSHPSIMHMTHTLSSNEKRRVLILNLRRR